MSVCVYVCVCVRVRARSCLSDHQCSCRMSACLYSSSLSWAYISVIVSLCHLSRSVSIPPPPSQICQSACLLFGLSLICLPCIPFRLPPCVSVSFSLSLPPSLAAGLSLSLSLCHLSVPEKLLCLSVFLCLSMFVFAS